MPTADKRPLKVFLCHAHSDATAVRGLYNRLVKDGVDAWLDKEKLLPGADWESEIRQAVRESDVVVVCHSKRFNKKGFRQKEVQIALEEADLLPKGEIFIIPARLEECDVLEDLQRWQWVDLFESDGYDRLLLALKARVDQVDGSSLHNLLEAASMTDDLTERYELIERAQVLAPEEDVAVQKEVGKARIGLYNLQRVTAIINLQLLKDQTNYDAFVGALAILESLVRKHYPFSDAELEEIKAARNWMNQKTIKAGGIISSIRQSSLQDVYLIYQQWIDLPPLQKTNSYFDVGDRVYSQVEYTGLLERAWRQNSVATCEQRLGKAQAVAKIDPISAKALLEHELGAQVERECLNPFTKVQELRKIPDFPYADKERERISNYIRLLAEPCEIAGAAKWSLEKARESSTPFDRYASLIKVRGLVWHLPNDPTNYILPFVDNEIYQAYRPAAQYRCDEIQSKVEGIQNEIEGLQRLSLEQIADQSGQLRDNLADLMSLSDCWPGTEYVLKLTIPGEPGEFKVRKPPRMESLKSLCHELATQLFELLRYRS